METSLFFKGYCKKVIDNNSLSMHVLIKPSNVLKLKGFLPYWVTTGLLPEYNQLVNGSVMKSYIKKVNGVEMKLRMMTTIDLLIIIVIKGSFNKFK